MHKANPVVTANARNIAKKEMTCICEEVWLCDEPANGWECITLSPSTKCSCEKSVTLLQYHKKSDKSNVPIIAILRSLFAISTAKVVKKLKFRVQIVEYFQIK